MRHDPELERLGENLKKLVKEKLEVFEPILEELEKRTGRRDFLKLAALGAIAVGGIRPAAADVDIWPDKIEIDGSQLAKANDVIVTATRVVAASDSKDKRSHYACDGTDDQVEINQAIQDLA